MVSRASVVVVVLSGCLKQPQVHVRDMSETAPSTCPRQLQIHVRDSHKYMSDTATNTCLRYVRDSNKYMPETATNTCPRQPQVHLRDMSETATNTFSFGRTLNFDFSSFFCLGKNISIKVNFCAFRPGKLLTSAEPIIVDH